MEVAKDFGAEHPGFGVLESERRRLVQIFVRLGFEIRRSGRKGDPEAIFFEIIVVVAGAQIIRAGVRQDKGTLAKAAAIKGAVKTKEAIVAGIEEFVVNAC